MKKVPLITLMTDFGVVDGYVGTMKGVMLDIAPSARLVDLSHDIAPQNFRQAAYVLYTAYPFFPSHTVHLVVVDPGVGSARRAIALRTPVGYFVGPDNGVFSYVMACETVEAVVKLANPRYQLSDVSHTFHGRDIFAPAAAHLAASVPLKELGPRVSDPITLPAPRLEIAPDRVVGEVLHADHFGNVITSIGHLTWREGELALQSPFRQTQSEESVYFPAQEATVSAAGREIAGVQSTYAMVERGQVLALVGSEGHLEIAVREGNAAQKLGLQPGDEVAVRMK